MDQTPDLKRLQELNPVRFLLDVLAIFYLFAYIENNLAVCFQILFPNVSAFNLQFLLLY